MSLVTIATAVEPAPRTVVYVWVTERWNPTLFLDPDDAEDFRSAYGGKVVPSYLFGSGERPMAQEKVKFLAHRRQRR